MNSFDEFTEEMVRYLTQHHEYEDFILYLDKHPNLHIYFVQELFQRWLLDPDHIDDHLEDLIGIIGRG